MKKKKTYIFFYFLFSRTQAFLHVCFIVSLGFTELLTLIGIWNHPVYRWQGIILDWQDYLVYYPFLSLFIRGNGVGCIVYDTKVKFPFSSYLLKWGASFLPCPLNHSLVGQWSQRNYIHGIEVAAPVTKTPYNQVKRIISQHLPVGPIPCLVQILTYT